MRIAFLGTSSFAVPVLDMLAASAHPVVLVVTRPDRARGRGRRVEPSPIGAAADRLGLERAAPRDVNAVEFVEVLREREPEILVVVAFGRILKEPLLALAPRGAVNLHGSLLPAYRGPAPVARALQHGEARTGVTLQFVALEVDAGDVIDAAEVAIDPADDAGTLSERLSGVAAALLERNLDALAAGRARRVVQDPGRVTYAPLLQKEEGRIPWHLGAETVRNHVRAMTPWPGAFTDLEAPARAPMRLIVRAAEVVPANAAAAPPGAVVSARGTFDVATGDGLLRITRVQRAGRGEMDAEAFLRGCEIPPEARVR